MNGLKLGFIGLGEMGMGMALNMCKSSEPFMISSSDPEKRERFARLGAETAELPSGLSGNDIVFLCLPDDKVVCQVLFGENGLLPGLKPGSVVVDFSTTTYTGAIAIHKELAEKGISFIDAPVSGMKVRADNGTLTVMCGGEKEVFERIRPFFERVGEKVLYMVGPGYGQLAKLVNQLLLDINIAALAEVLPMAARLGMDCALITEVINSGTGRSYASEFFVPNILENRFDYSYSMKNAYKDLVSAWQISAEYAIPMPVLAAATATYQTALQKGLGEGNKSGMIKVFEDILDVRFRKSPEKQE